MILEVRLYVYGFRIKFIVDSWKRTIGFRKGDKRDSLLRTPNCKYTFSIVRPPNYTSPIFFLLVRVWNFNCHFIPFTRFIAKETPLATPPSPFPTSSLCRTKTEALEAYHTQRKTTTKLS